jgi:carnosine N-methyltransferase
LAEPPFSYLETLNQVDDAIESNADLARQIIKNGLSAFHGTMGPPEPSDKEPQMPPEWEGAAKAPDIDKARSTIRQFFRDWTAEGAEERAASYGPVMKTLAKKRLESPPGPPMKVLVPGAGLGRLVFELCLHGYEAEGNEISYHQLMASNYILNCTKHAGQHTIYPWLHTFSNHRTRANHLRGYRVPDVHPASAINARSAVGSMSMVASDFLCLYSDEEHQDAYDAVACVFFLDTAPNLIRYLQTILHCLKPGGLLINLGPLLWHFEGHAPGNNGADDDGDGEHDFNNSSGIADPGSFELTDDEVRALVERLGFQIVSWESGIDAPYIADKDSMLRSTYMVSSWVARKPAQ